MLLTVQLCCLLRNNKNVILIIQNFAHADGVVNTHIRATYVYADAWNTKEWTTFDENNNEGGVH